MTDPSKAILECSFRDIAAVAKLLLTSQVGVGNQFDCGTTGVILGSGLSASQQIAFGPQPFLERSPRVSPRTEEVGFATDLLGPPLGGVGKQRKVWMRFGWLVRIG